MKTFFILVLSVVMSSTILAQSAALAQKGDVYIPRTLYAGTLMSARTAATTYDDTTQVFQTRSWARVYVGLETAANDSVRLLLSYFPSKDGSNFSKEVLFDSLSSTGTVGIIKYFALPADAMGAVAVKVRVYGDANLARYSANPSTTVTTKIIRLPY